MSDKNDELKDLAKSMVKANKVKNEASREESKARKALYAAMSKVGLGKMSFMMVLGGKRVPYEASIETPKRVTVDIELLKKYLPEDTFMQVVTATQASVKEHAGEAVLRKCCKESPGTENVFVKVVK